MRRKLPVPSDLRGVALLAIAAVPLVIRTIKKHARKGNSHRKR